jgi:hypothetical protein
MKGRRPGRPPLDDTDESVHVSLTLTAKQFDRFCQDARREEISVAEAIRRELERIKIYKP